MKKQDLMITILSLTAVALLIATFLTPPNPVEAATVIKGRQYQACTATTQQGTDGLYVLDNQTGTLTFLSYDPTTKRVVPRATEQVTSLFPPQQGTTPAPQRRF